jgi:hypothetical protein
MLETLFTIGQAISAVVTIYGAYLSIDYVFFGERSVTTLAARDLPDVGRHFNV